MSKPPESTGVRRRDFLKILGVTGATTATVGCGSGDVERLIPYVQSPDQTVPGVSTYFATTCRECAAGCGVIAEVRDGRAIKLEGNPEHPLNRGALCAPGQAALQGLYNPDRYRGPMKRQGNALVPTTWEDALQILATRLGEARSRGQSGSAAFVNQHETGAFPAFLDSWLGEQGMPPHLSYDALADTGAIAANREAYGVAWPQIDFAAARLIISFGADFLDGWGLSVPQQLAFADARARFAGGPRFIYVGARRSLTGLNADEWIPCLPGGEAAIARALTGASGAGTTTSMEQAVQASGVEAAVLQRLASEVAAARPLLALASGTAANATELAAAVRQLNAAGGALGATIRPADGATAFDGVATFAEMLDLTARMQAGQVPVLMVRGANPAHTLPPSLGFAAAMERVPFKVSFSSYPDETTERCDLVLPDHHPLESWGAAQVTRGVIGLQQPTMAPIFRTMATADVLMQVARRDPAMAARYAGDFRGWLTQRLPGGDNALSDGLQRGLLAGTLASRQATARTLRPAPAAAAPQGDFHVVVYPSATLGDGRGANKPWLQELPDPVTKIAWQSWVELHPSTARRLGVDRGDLLEVRTANGAITAPAYPYLGIRPDTVAVALGQGHQGTAERPFTHRDLHLTGYGRYADGVGINAATLLGATDARGALLWTTRGSVRVTGGHVELVSTEGSARQHGRGIAQAIAVTGLGGTRQASGAEHADEISTQGTEGAGAGHSPQGAPGGDHAPAAAGQAPAGGHGAPTEGGAHSGAHVFPGDASHEFLPGLRAPVANDAQGEMGDQRSNEKGMYDPDHWSGMAKRRWAMTIDLARCTGCSACVTACYAENNIPTVGARWQTGQVMAPHTPGANMLRSREMNWIRLERYYEGAENAEAGLDADFEARFVPMLCQHCGNAPCEPVCPVYATYHAPDGLNVQVYNRCVGTRYCSNNCPYKVRYFNWFGYGEPRRAQYAFPEPLHLQLNPDVTVRGKGVMEKCTFCVQRIREAENRASLEGRSLSADEFTVACAQACPSRAITFGDAADPAWAVAQRIADERAYHVFEELNTYTAVVYLKRVTHPAPAAPARS